MIFIDFSKIGPLLYKKAAWKEEQGFQMHYISGEKLVVTSVFCHYLPFLKVMATLGALRLSHVYSFPPPILSKFVRHVTGILVQIWQAELFPGNERDERSRS